MVKEGGRKCCSSVDIVRQIWCLAVTIHCAVRNEMSEVQHFVSLSNFFTSTYTFEERHLTAKAKCHSEVTDPRGKIPPANSKCRDFIPAVFITAVQNCRCPSGWLSSRKWNLLSWEGLRHRAV